MKKTSTEVNHDQAQDELIIEFYGINPFTRRVDNVGVTRSGNVSHWTERGYKIRRLEGSDLRTQIIEIFGFTDLIELSPRTMNSERLRILLELQATALSRADPSRMSSSPDAGEEHPSDTAPSPAASNKLR